MKKLLLSTITCILIFAMLGGTYCAAMDVVADELVFSSLEELLAAYKAVKAGTAAAELADLAEKVKFAELDELYFPTGIPAEYKLCKIRTNYLAVSFLYLTESDMVSEEAITKAIAQQKEFDFCFYREKQANPMESLLKQFDAAAKDLIDGIYYFNNPYSVYWGSDNAILHLYMPLSYSNVSNTDKVKSAAVDAVDVETGARQPYSPPVLAASSWWQKLPPWLQWILRYILFGWI